MRDCDVRPTRIKRLTSKAQELITDVLFRRYPDRWIIGDDVPLPFALLVRQAALVVYNDIASRLPNRARLFEVPETRLAREFGAMALGRAPTSEQNCMQFLGEPYDLWNDSHGSPDDFIKRRLSLVELLFREAEAILQGFAPKQDAKAWWTLLQKRASPPKNAVEDALSATMVGIDELNARFRNAGLPFEYHGGVIQKIDDSLTTQQIEQPFWSLVSDPKFTNVEKDIKEAIDRRDGNKPDAAFHALKALESVLRILSDELRRTRGTERGASEYIDNLVADKPSRYIDKWEADALKSLFRSLRNPMGHGPGSAQPLALRHEQSTCAIEFAMSWIKSLVRRRE